MIAYTCHNPTCEKVFFKQATLASQGRGKYCSKACQYAHRPAYKTLEARFWAKVAVCAHGRTCSDCCWLWQGAIHKSGHGLFSIKKDGQWRHIGAHCQAWILLHEQPIPEGLLGLHRCNRPGCVNGSHIYTGTRADNTRDALAYGSLPHNHYVHGESVNTAKLKETDIPLIRQLRAQGLTLKAISLRYGISISVVHHIVNWKSWKHIP